MPTPLYERIYAQARRIPYGAVTSYGEIARLCGIARGARLVGWALRAAPPESQVPWQRIINKKGQISIVNPRIPKSLQRSLLEEEGVTVHEQNGWYVVDDAFWWKPEA